MNGRFLQIGGLLLLSFVYALCDIEGSGSGDVLEGGDGEILYIGSGAEPSHKIPLQPYFNIDDEDNDDITLVDASGNGEDELDMSGDGSQTGEFSAENVKCTHSMKFCWCTDLNGKEIPGTQAPADRINCENPPFVLLHAGSDTTIIQDTTPRWDRTIPRGGPVVTKRPPHIIKTDRPTKADDMSTQSKSGKGWQNGEIERERVVPLFTHPGILAAVIGGGIVALLCALLLIMFVVYRMRKKDEGSYPIDPDAKPPRLHTYTRAPNKEFYA